ncbi:MAG TPA: cytochrome b [Rhizomicrobium sp.]|nr:cytochrome b [Rhizomicrobium sp.]
MALRNTEERYGIVAMTLHWLIAIAVVCMIAFGYYLSTLPITGPNLFELVQLHKSVGLTVLALSLLRVVWRLVNPVPPLPGTLSKPAKILARVTHVLLYVAIVAIPFTGWAMVSASPLGIPTRWFGLFEWPHIAPLAHLPYSRKEDTEEAIHSVHAWLAYGTAALVLLHASAALVHHRLLKDDTLRRMLPGARLKEGP